MLDKKAVFTNTAVQVIVRFITLAFTLISIKLLTNYLGPSGVGNYNTITTYVNFFIVFADLGLFSVAVREISKKPENEKKILSNMFVIRLISALIACLVAIIIVFLTKYDNNIKFGALIATGFILFNLLSSVYDVVLQYRLKMQYSALAEFLSKFISIVALYLIIRFSGNFLLITSTIALSGLLIFIFKWLFSIRFIKFWPEYDKKISSWIFSLSWPLGIVIIVNNLYFKLDTLMLFVIKGAATVGIYSVAYKILEVTTFIAAYFAAALKPTISKEITNDKEGLSSVIQKAISVMLLVSLPITIVCIAFSHEIILFISNKDFIAGSTALVILSMSLPFIYLDLLLAEIMIAQDSRKLLLKISGFMLLFNFSANLIVIPRYSFVGAAWTTLVSEIVLLSINYWYTRKIVPYKIDFKFISKLILLSLLTLIISFMLKATSLNFLILIAIIFVIYLVLGSMLNITKIKTIKELLFNVSRS